ncbi:tyrosine-type recombinase/integrase [Brumicola blandensis]|uniref:Tyrosine-type recombinase/integrase n=1 Tax=Brumicola blandensis TaxID=3075611 RepID=A0AAW8QWP6_9ALTE|nr:integrase arm-type DNA-binding domain-containing protein [Alteromonas sp. W409]MDT0581442.1 tyrosine-type recombinase/integrase [Alteromonas sp. W409]
MPKVAKELSDKEVKALLTIDKDGMYPVGRVSGLNIQIKPPNGASWILRTVINGKRKSIGLGGYPEVSLAHARHDASELKRKIRLDGYDPVEERLKRRSLAKVAEYSDYTFKRLASEYIEKRSSEFKTTQQLRKLTSMFDNYAYPAIGAIRVQDIDLNAIKAMLDPIWHTKTETANRLRIYVGHVFDIAIARGIYKELNPARWDGGLKTLLPAPQKVSKTKHHKALPVEELPIFWSKLIQQDWMGAKVLSFGILTGTRSSEMRGALWSEIDFEQAIWKIPAKRMKGENPKDHNIPLSQSALSILERMPRTSKYIFPSNRDGVLTDATVSKVPKRIGYDVTAHGFRSTFKDWARQYVKFNHQPFDDDLTELALAHVNNDSTRAAYARDALIEERRPLMKEWAEYCEQKTSDDVEKGKAKNG